MKKVIAIWCLLGATAYGATDADVYEGFAQAYASMKDSPSMKNNQTCQLILNFLVADCRQVKYDYFVIDTVEKLHIPIDRHATLRQDLDQLKRDNEVYSDLLESLKPIKGVK